MISVIKKMSVTNKMMINSNASVGLLLKIPSQIYKKTILHKNHENKERGRRRSRNRVFSECV